MGGNWVFQLSHLSSLKGVYNPRISHMREFISSSLKWYLTERGPPKKKQMWLVNWEGELQRWVFWEEVLRPRTLNKSSWMISVGRITRGGEKQGQRTHFCHLSILPCHLYLQPMSWSPVIYKYKCSLQRNYEF